MDDQDPAATESQRPRGDIDSTSLAALKKQIHAWMAVPPPPDPPEAQLAKLEALRQQYQQQMTGNFKYLRAVITHPLVAPAVADPVTPPVPLHRAFVAGPIVAYRVWRVTEDGDGIRLVAISVGQSWPCGRPLEAVHVSNYFHERCESPQQHCGCGIYAFKRPDAIELSHDIREGLLIVHGQVALWGRVFEHELGYRAQYAYPVRLWWPGESPMPGFPVSPLLRDTLARLRDAYGCEIGRPTQK